MATNNESQESRDVMHPEDYMTKLDATVGQAGNVGRLFENRRPRLFQPNMDPSGLTVPSA
jgi:hypothetical protein